MRSIQEKEYLKLCKLKIETFINNGNSSNWTQQDYEHLIELIYEKTKVQLSVSTLKRIWVYKPDNIPNITTLNTLSRFIGYRDWFDFKSKNVFENETAISLKPSVKVRRPATGTMTSTYIAIGLTLVVTVIILAIPAVGSTRLVSAPKAGDVIFELKKNRLAGLPNTVVFNYDISKTGYDSGYIQQDWDESKRVRIPADKNYLTCIYYYPGYFDAKIIVGDKVVKNTPLFIMTDGWLPLITTERYQDKPLYVDKKIIENNILHITPGYVKDLGIDVTKDYYTGFYKIRDFGDTRCDNFTLVSEIKNNVKEGGSACQYSEIVLKFENGRLLTPFCNIGCTSVLNVNYGEKYLRGTENDFLNLGIDLSDWTDIKIQSVNKHVTVYVKGEKVYDLAFNASLGRLTGFHYLFNGCGAVRKIELSDQNNNIIYVDHFGENS